MPWKALCAVIALAWCYTVYMIWGPGGDGAVIGGIAAAMGVYIGATQAKQLRKLFPGV